MVVIMLVHVIPMVDRIFATRGFVLVDEAVVVPLRHGGGLEVDGEVAHVVAIPEEMFDVLEVVLGLIQALCVDNDVGRGDGEVAADFPAAEILHAHDARQGP